MGNVLAACSAEALPLVAKKTKYWSDSLYHRSVYNIFIGHYLRVL